MRDTTETARPRHSLHKSGRCGRLRLSGGLQSAYELPPEVGHSADSDLAMPGRGHPHPPSASLPRSGSPAQSSAPSSGRTSARTRTDSKSGRTLRTAPHRCRCSAAPPEAPEAGQRDTAAAACRSPASPGRRRTQGSRSSMTGARTFRGGERVLARICSQFPECGSLHAVRLPARRREGAVFPRRRVPHLGGQPPADGRRSTTGRCSSSARS